jgi:hypothetical protein
VSENSWKRVCFSPPGAPPTGLGGGGGTGDTVSTNDSSFVTGIELFVDGGAAQI